MHIVIAESTYTLRVAAAKVALEVSEGRRHMDDLIVNGKIFQPAEFHAGAIMFTSDYFMVTQVKGHADGGGKIHLHLAGGGVKKHHFNLEDAVSEGLNAEIQEEVGDIRKFGLKAQKLGIGYERISLGEDSDYAITNYQGIIHELKSDEGRISSELMKEVANEQFASFVLEFRDLDTQRFLESEQQGIEYVKKSDHELAVLWEVGGYPLIDFRNKDSFTVENGELFAACDIIRAKFNKDRSYAGTEKIAEKLAVQGTFAPQIVFYAQLWQDSFS